MVRGLTAEGPKGGKKDGEAKNFQFQEEELESQLTHEEIEEISQTYHLTW